MRTRVGVLLEPVIGDDLSLLGGGEPLGIKNLPPKGSVESFVVSDLPRRSWIDADGFDCDLWQPRLHGLCDFGKRLKRNPD